MSLMTLFTPEPQPESPRPVQFQAAPADDGDKPEPIPSLAAHAEKTRQILEARKAELEATQAAVSNLQANAKDIEAEIAALVAADTVLAPYLPAKVEHPDTVRDEVTGPEHDPLDGATQEVAAFNGALMQGAAA